jgi:hypothetical protein
MFRSLGPTGKAKKYLSTGMLAVMWLSTFAPTVKSVKISSANRTASRSSNSADPKRPTKRDSATKDRVVEAYGNLPLAFEINKGQVDSPVEFISRGDGYSLFLTPREAIMFLRGQIENDHPDTNRPTGGNATDNALLKIKLDGANSRPPITGVDELPGRVNYFIGKDPRRWRTNVLTYSKVKYSNVYPGVDMIYYGNQQQLEYDFIVAPGADPRQIKLHFEGARDLRIDSNGDLVLVLNGKEVRQHKPYVYQDEHGIKREIACQYMLTGKQRVAFKLGDYNVQKPLIIDPVLSYSTYLGGIGDDEGHGITTDTSGNAYVTGITFSNNFPTLNSLQTYRGAGDVFITKLNPAGTSKIYSTYIGGNAEETGYDIAVDGAENVFVTGGTDSTDFPTTVGALDRQCGTDGTCNPNPLNSVKGTDVFVLKLNAAGSALLYSTYIGGNERETGHGLAIDSSGNAYVGGWTGSGDFPTTVGAYDRQCGTDGNCNPIDSVNKAEDAFVLKLNATGSALLYSTFVGGSGSDYALDIGLDSSGNVYFAGTSNNNTYPTLNAYQSTWTAGSDPQYGNYEDAVVTKVNPTGTGLVFSTYIGGTGKDYANGIALDNSGAVYIIGYTSSSNYPTANPFQLAFAGGTYDSFVTKLNPAGNSLAYSTYLGGTKDDYGYAIAVDSSGNAYVLGDSHSGNYPLVNPVQTQGGSDPVIFSGNFPDITVAKLNPAGNALLYSTYLGGSNERNSGSAIAVDSSGNAYVTGYTLATNFPAANALQPNKVFGTCGFFPCSDAVIVKIADTNGHAIGGRIADSGGNGIVQVTVTLTGSQTGDTLTDANGNYSFPNLAPSGNYTVTPSKNFYTFAPTSQTFNSLSSPQTADFTGTSTAAITINGKVSNGPGTGISAVTITLTGSQNSSVQTDANGNYSFANLPAGGNYTVTPSRNTDTFAPANRSFNNLGSSQTVNFTLVYKITGRVTDAGGNGVVGIPVPLSGGVTSSTLTDAAGNYSFLNLPANLNYTVTPSKPDNVFTYTFNPPSRTFTNLIANQIGDFSVTVSTKVSFNATADSYVQDGTSASTNFGTVTPLLLKTTNTSGQKRDVYFKFDLSGLSQSIVNAKLRISAALSAAGSVGTSGNSVTDTTWSESGITWNNKPAITAIPGSTATVTSTTFATYELDVTTYIVNEKAAGRNVVSLALHNGSNSTPHILVNSREAASNKPQLVITTNVTTNVAPAVSITAPGNGSVHTAPANIIINSNASDSDGSISSVAYFAGTSPIGTSTTGPNYQITWPGIGAGSYTLFAIATDNRGSTTTSSPISINVNPPNNPPAVFMTSPLEGTIFSAGSNISLSAKATDSDGTLSKVEFFAGSTLVGTATTPGADNIYSVTWNNVASGAYAITAKATDNANAVIPSAAVNISVVSQTGLSPTADAYVRDGASASTNFGTATELQVQASATAGSNRESHLRFDLQTVTGIVRAKLRLYGKLSDTSGVNVPLAAYSVANTTWIESGSNSMTWNTKSPTGTLLSTTTITDNVARWYEFDVTSHVKNERDVLNHNLVSLAVKALGNSSPYATFNSREANLSGDIRPQLIIWTTQPRNALLVVGSSNLGPGDNAAKTRLQNLGFTVTTKVASNSLVSTDADGKTVIVVSSTVTATSVGTKFRHAAVPVVNWEFDVFDDMGMTGTVSNTDFGTTTQTQTQLAIINSTHALAAGLSSGNQTVATTATNFSWGNPNTNPNAVKIATVVGDANKFVIFGYDEGLAMPGLPSPARRVGLFMSDLTANSFNTNGGLLFDAALKWATEVITSPVIKTITPGSGPVGTSVTITGINFGSTQGGSTLTFNGVAASPSSWSEKTIVAPVPLFAITGPVVITVSGVAGNGFVFAVGEVDSDADGLPDNWEIQYFGNLSQTATGDPDGDGINNLQEYQQGRNPTKNALSDSGDFVNLKVHTPLSP